MLLLIDNYDSFVHNLARYFEQLGQPTKIVRNNEIDVDGVWALAPEAVVLSPGPCTPREAGASLELVRALHANVPILGVCLGHQVIAEALGGRIIRAPAPVHGRATPIRHDGGGLFVGIPSPLTVGRYHSLVVDPNSMPSVLQATAWTDDGILMAFQHARLPVFGVQFHPESILTDSGYALLTNFLRLAGMAVTREPGALAQNELLEPRAKHRSLPNRPVTF